MSPDAEIFWHYRRWIARRNTLMRMKPVHVLFLEESILRRWEREAYERGTVVLPPPPPPKPVSVVLPSAEAVYTHLYGRAA